MVFRNDNKIKLQPAILLLLCSLNLMAQGTQTAVKAADSNNLKTAKVYRETDIIDIAIAIAKPDFKRQADTTAKKKGKIYVAPLPGIGYSLNTGFSAVVNANIAFYTSSKKDANISTIVTSVNYTQLNQVLLPVLSNIWIFDNKYNIQGNWLYAKFPQASFGLGGRTALNNSFQINYDNLRLITALYRAIAPDLLVGPGYSYEYFWNLGETSTPTGNVTDMTRYGFSKTIVASAPSLNLLYDTRRNSINAEGGNYANISYRTNFTILGSDANWQSLVIDLRKYIKLPAASGNILAFWAYEWLTFGGDKAPYVLLPNTGGDPYVNTGRGYEPGRFRGKDMLYFEGEYRYKITRNGLIGGVVFTNVESFPEPVTNRFEVVYPGMGAGIRLKFNKYSRTNVAVDYGFGTDGSRGFFINLGEIF